MEKKIEYNEIKELYKYCVKIGINAVLETLCDGYAIRFPDGGDLFSINILMVATWVV